MTIIEIIAAILFLGVGLTKGSGNYSGSNKELYLSLNGGVAKSDSSNAKWEVAHGGAIGYFITPHVDVGIEAVTTRQTKEILGTKWTYSDTPILFKFDLHSTGLLNGFHFGLRVGTSSRKQFTEDVSDDPYLAQSFTYGAATGYEYTFSSGISVGIKALYLHLDAKEKSYQIGTTNTLLTFEKQNYLMALTEFKYLF